MLTILEGFDRIGYANFVVEMVKSEYIAWEMNHLNHFPYYCLLVVIGLAIAVVGALMVVVVDLVVDSLMNPIPQLAS